MSDRDEKETAEDILDSLGFGDLVDLLKKSDVFSERMEEVNEKLKERLDSQDLEDVKPQFDYNFSINTLGDSSRKRSRPRKGSRPRKEKETDSWDSDSVKFKEGDSKKSKKRKSEGSGKDEPLIDLFDQKDGVRIVAIFPDLSDPKELQLELEEGKLVLRTPNNKKELKLPYPVREDHSVDYKNGIFDIQYEKK